MTRITLTVEIDLDPIPGALHTADDMRTQVQSHLDLIVGHYRPVVIVTDDGSEHSPQAIARRAVADNPTSTVAAIKAYRNAYCDRYGSMPGLIEARDACYLAGAHRIGRTTP